MTAISRTGSKPAEVAVSPLEAVPVAEVLALAVHHLAELPLATTLIVELDGGGELEIWTTDREVAALAVREGAPVFTAAEFETMCLAVEAERFFAADLRRWHARKEANPSARLTPREAHAGVRPAPRRPGATWWSADPEADPKGQWMPHGPTFGWLLWRLEARLVGVEYTE